MTNVLQLALDNEKRPVILSSISFMHYLHLSGKILHQWISLRDLQIPLTPRLQKFPKCRISVDLNIADQPLNYIKAAFEGASIAANPIAALLIPILAWATQVLNYKLMPQATSSAEGAVDTMQASAKTTEYGSY